MRRGTTFTYDSPVAKEFQEAVQPGEIDEAYGFQLVAEIVKGRIPNELREYDMHGLDDAGRLAKLQRYLDNVLITLWNKGLLWREDVRLVAMATRPGFQFKWKGEKLPETVEAL